METVNFKVQDILSQPINGHPSNNDRQRIDRLENIVIQLAKSLDAANLEIDELKDKLQNNAR